MIFDAHFHIIDKRFPLVANQGYLPKPFSVADYQKKVKDLPIKGGAVVSGSFQAYDQDYLINALSLLGENFVGVTQLPNTTTNDEIIYLHSKGIRAVRFNLFRGGKENIETLKRFAHRVHDIASWHVELYINAQDLAELMPIILRLPKVSIDHLGLSEDALDNIVLLAEQEVKIKASGFMRVDFAVLPALKKIVRANPTALMFGTDYPGTRASRTFCHDDLALIENNFRERVAHKILWENAAEFYGII